MSYSSSISRPAPHKAAERGEISLQHGFKRSAPGASNAKRMRLCSQQPNAASSHHVAAVHYLDSMCHAAHWLKQHELQRQQVSLCHKLQSIRSCEYLPILAEISTSRRRSFDSSCKSTVASPICNHHGESSEAMASEISIGDASDLSEATYGHKKMHYEQYVAAHVRRPSPIEAWPNAERFSINIIPPTSDSDIRGDAVVVSHALDKEDADRVLSMQCAEFWQEVHRETSLVSKEAYFLPPGYDVPCCNCGVPCVLRRVKEGDVFHQMWFCEVDSEVCMASYFYNSIDGFGNVVNAAVFSSHGGRASLNSIMSEVGDVIYPHLQSSSFSDWSVGNRFVELEEGICSSISPAHQFQRQEHSIVKDTALGKLTLQQFWDHVNQSQVSLDNDTTQFISHQLPTHICDCNLHCQLAFCVYSGGIYALCPRQACFYLATVLKQPALLQLDVGQIVKFGHSSLDRFTTWSHAMRWFGKSFTQKFILKLVGQPPEVPYPRGSYAMVTDQRVKSDVLDSSDAESDEGVDINSTSANADANKTALDKSDVKIVVPSYDHFISYRGATGAGWIWLSLCGHNNLLPALLFVWCFCPFIVLALHFVPYPCEKFPHWLVSCNSQRRFDMGYYYIMFGTWGATIVCLIVLFWNPLFSWVNIPYLAPRKRLFLDKFCVHQSNPNLTSAGILRLALFLRNSKELLCLFDDEFCSRMWCVWELATYLRMRKNPKVTFVCISQRCCEIIILIVYFLQRIVVFISKQFVTLDMFSSIINYWDDVNKKVNNPWAKPGAVFKADSYENVVFVSVVFVCSNILASVGFILGQRHFRSHDKLRKTIKNYDIRNAQCASEADRGLLLRFVNDIFFERDEQSQRSSSSSSHGQMAHGEQESDHRREGQQQSLESGLDNFNEAVKSEVPKLGVHTTGWRKFVILSYVAAVLVPLQYAADVSQEDILDLYDSWAFRGLPRNLEMGQAGGAAQVSNESQRGWVQGSGIAVRYILSICFDKLILAPFGAFLFGVLVKLFLHLQELVMKFTGAKYWMTVMVFLPCFLFIETVCCFRPQLISIISAMTTNGCIYHYFPTRLPFIPIIKGQRLNHDDTLSDFAKKHLAETRPDTSYVTEFSVWRGVYILWALLNPDDYDNLEYATLSVEASATVDALCWIFLILPITIFTAYIYEPRWCRTWRLKLWHKFKAWIRPADDTGLPLISYIHEPADDNLIHLKHVSQVTV